ncbi:thermonuclease family protein [Nonomuraea dietziae]|uniref:thermonuclease family protein n=1 Tax=Nonomuraea dietziae TaxID=65515 RepID=UPI0033C757C7
MSTPELGVYHATIGVLNGTMTPAMVDVGFGVRVHAKLNLAVPGEKGLRPVRKWVTDRQGLVVVRVTGRAPIRTPAELVEGSAPYLYRVADAHVVDGDTLDTRLDLGFGVHIDARMRLLGLNVAEKTTADGVEVAAWVREWVAGQLGHLTVQTVKDKREKYGRWLATVYGRSGLPSLNELLLAAGMAQPYDGGARAGA